MRIQNYDDLEKSRSTNFIHQTRGELDFRNRGFIGSTGIIYDKPISNVDSLEIP